MQDFALGINLFCYIQFSGFGDTNCTGMLM